MIRSLTSALSGLQVFSKKIENNAHNVANMNTEGFRKNRVLLSDQVPQEGVKATVERVDAPGPFAAEMTEQGYALVEQSNVDLGEELPEMMRNTQGYKANLTTLRTADEMMRHLLDIKA